VRWTTDAPENTGTVDVFAQTIDGDGDPFGDQIAILTHDVITRRIATFSSDDTGLYDITVRLTLSDGELIQDTAPQPVRVSTLPGIVWLGSLAGSNPQVEGAIFGGVNFEDNAGTSFTPAGDLNGDGASDFVISARYGKPFFANPTGIGIGEAYLLYGAGGTNKLTGTYNLNSVGTNTLRGVTFAGVRTPENSNVTDGMSSVTRIPDVDGDGRSELVFGFPNTASRGHNASPNQDGVAHPRSLMTLERENQFLHGGIVLVSSRNSILGDPLSGSPSILLDLVGQDFDSTCVEPETDPPQDAGEFFVSVQGAADADPPCAGECGENNSGTTGKADGNDFIDHGFVFDLARDYFSTYVYSFEFYGGTLACSSASQFVNHDCLDAGVPHVFCQPFTASCEPFSPGLHVFTNDPDGDVDQFGMPSITRHSGYYPRFLTFGGDDTLFANEPVEPLGARVIGVGLGDSFGASLTRSNPTGVGAGDLIVSAPTRSARGLLLGPEGGPEGGGEITGLGTDTRSNSGVAYLFDLRSLWTADNTGAIPPKPHQYIVGEASHCSGPDRLIDNIDAIRIAGFAGDQITNIVGIDDYNGDGRNDFAIGAPNANAGQGRVYVAYRREQTLEDDYVLEKLALAPNDPERLDGMLVVSNSLDAFGTSLATGFDFNDDGISDLVVGSPNASGGVGEVIVLFGTSDLVSPEDGITVSTLLTGTRTAQGDPVAVRITGNVADADGLFGFNVANGGDIDGDGTNDLLIAAPGAAPRFDPDPNDGTDALTDLGVDLDLDGEQDAVPGDDDLLAAGIVYVVFGKNRLDQIAICETSGALCASDDDCGTGDFCISPDDMTINIDKLGTSQLRGFMVVGRRAGDRIGGGDAGDSTQGGIAAKAGRGRSQGLAAAGDVDGDGRADVLIGSVLADPRRDPNTDVGVQNGGEAYLVYGSAAP
jgi:hypothetical protein